MYKKLGLAKKQNFELSFDPSMENRKTCHCHYGTYRETNRICHLSPRQTEKSPPEGKRIMSETRFTELPALSADPRVGISQSASETDM